MRELKDSECYCCNNGCGECDLNENEQSACCGAPVFIWDNKSGEVVTD